MGIISSALDRVLGNRLLSFEHVCLDHTTRPVAVEPEDTTDHALASGPTPDDEAEWLGYSLLVAGEDANPARECAYEGMARFYRGWYAARMTMARKRDRDRNAWIALLDTMNDDDRIEARCPLRVVAPYED